MPVRVCTRRRPLQITSTKVVDQKTRSRRLNETSSTLAQSQSNSTKQTITSGNSITGDVAGSENVVISKAGNVRGNIVAPRVTLEDGAIFKGSIDMDPGEVSASKASKPAISSVPEGKKAPSLDLKSG